MAEADTALEQTPTSSAPPPSEENLSLSDHEAKYSGQGQLDTQAEAETKPVETPAAEPEPDSGTPETDERDEKGRFLPRKRHRAASQEATPADVPRIRELTARLRAAEAERDALKAQTSRPAGAAEVSTSRQPVVPPPPTPKPTPDKFDDYSAYIEALTDWKTEQAFAAAEQKREQAEKQRRDDAERRRIEKSWVERVEAAKQKYPDFAAVAIESDTLIPSGSLIDAWILQHKTGPDILYYLQTHPTEIQAMLQLPVLEQAESLALLAQRFNGHGRAATAATGSAPASLSSPPPRPPNPVRTGPSRSGGEPPDPDKAGVFDHERYWPQSHRSARV